MEQEFFDYLIQQNYITEETLQQWTREYQKYRNVFASTPPNQFILKPHEKTRIIKKTPNKTEVISSEVWEKIKKAPEEVENKPLLAAQSKDEIDLLMEIEKYAQSLPTKNPNSEVVEPDSTRSLSSEKETNPIDSSTIIFRLQEMVPKKVITEFDPLMQPTRLSMEEEVRYFELALHEKQKAIEFSKIKNFSEVLNSLLKSFSFLSIVHYLNPENTVITHEKRLLQEWLEAFLFDDPDI